MGDSHQIARRVLADLDSLVARGDLQAPQLFDIRAQLHPIAHPPPPAISPRPALQEAHAPRKQVRAVWSYDGAEDDELSFREGDQIEISEEVSSGWWKGRVTKPAAGGVASEKVGLFPSNYVEAIQDQSGSNLPSAVPLPPRRNLPPLFPTNGPAPPSNASDTIINEKQNENSAYNHGAVSTYGQHQPQQYSSLGPGPWRPGVARWSTGEGQQQLPPPIPPPPQQGYQSPQPPQSHNMGYYNQPPMPYGPATPAAYGTQQPVVQSEEEAKKNSKYKKLAGRMGETMAGGFAGGVGFGIGSHLF